MGSRQPPLFRLTSEQALASLVIALLFLFGALSPLAAQQKPGFRAQPGEAAILSLGGRLYDNHWAVVGRQPPQAWHPLFPQGVKIAPSATWRCTSCHGWDYMGSDGHLGKLYAGSAMKSLAGVAGKDPKQIVAILESPSHASVTAPMSPGLLLALAKFLSYGQQGMADLVNDGGKAKGDPLRGKDIYEGTCQRCHNADGKAPIYGEAGDQPSLGWVVRNRPEQAVHKIRNGVPLADMLSLRFLSMDRLSDLLAYLQSLDAR